jgi:hypothetical protein
MKTKKVILTPYQQAHIEWKLEKAQAKRLGVNVSQLKMLDEIKQAIKDFKNKKQ